ncbi:hypothetical protein QNI19_25225 [Cytophagaceae bacterium DM2B3-1]|uniref:Glycoside hydrolase family 5 domain-containing protein n=1 Tax=Xanthocytophaga flava TaxID=3048013 RepID=A0ABT7CTG6_9BACT|nr:hypothetical protein [Xanthocytophaga flavus]MDJ1496265.1 hypothetical protein [Xanthocytophaga flavus]
MARIVSFWIKIICVLGVGSIGKYYPLKAQVKSVLHLHPQNSHYFLYQNKPMVLVGSGEHYGSVINLDFDYKKYLHTIANEGLNVTRVFMGAYVEKLGDFGITRNNIAPREGCLLLPWARSKTPGYVLGGDKFDLTVWDDAYFTRLKDFMTEAARLGIMVEINLFSSYYEDGWKYSAFNRLNNVNQTDTITSKQVNTLANGNILGYQEKYVRKLVQELLPFGNFYFEIQNEPWWDQSEETFVWNEYGAPKDWFTQIQIVSQKSREWQKKVAQWIREEEQKLSAKPHLISQNISNFYYPVADTDSNVSIFNFHYALPKAVTDNYYLNKVVGFNETGFAGREDKTYRRQAWRFLMAGGGLFNHLDYSFSVGNETGQDTSYKAPGGGNAILRKQLSVLKHFFDRIGFINLSPDASVVQTAPGAVTYALSDRKSQWVIYLESMIPRMYDLTIKLPKGVYDAEWFDVTTGKSIQKVSVGSGKLSVPGNGEDRVVVIRKSSTGK